MAEMQIKIAADVSSAVSGLNKLNRQLEETGKDANNLGNAVQQAGAKIRTLPNVTGQATSALTNFGRVVQDAPYGLIGIANNIDPLVTSFNQLKASTGSTRAALSELISGLAGPAGFAIAISTITSLLVKFSDQLFTSSKAVSNAELANINYKDSVDLIDKSIVQLRNNLDFSTQLEKINNELRGLEGFALNIANAQVEIGNNNKFIADLDSKIAPLQSAFNNATKEAKGFLTETQKFRELPAERFAAGAQQYILGKRREKDALFQNFVETGKINEDLLKSLAKTDQLRFANLQISITELDSLLGKRNEVVQKNALLEQQIQLDRFKKLKEVKPDDGFIPGIGELTKGYIEDAKRFPLDRILSDLFNKKLAKAFEKPKEVKIPLRFNFAQSVEDFNNALQENERAFNSTLDRINQQFANIQVGALSSVGEAIGAALSGNDIGNAFKSFGNVLAAGLEAIGKELVAIGGLAELTRDALASIFTKPGLAIAAGIGLIAAAAALRSRLGEGLQARALGGPVSGGQPYLVGERGPELFVPQVSGGIVPNNSVGSFMGGRQSGGSGMSVLRGQDILLAYARTQRSQLRVNG